MGVAWRRSDVLIACLPRGTICLHEPVALAANGRSRRAIDMASPK
jgi:hypothetical protein